MTVGGVAILPQTSPSAFQNPSAPSPVGALKSGVRGEKFGDLGLDGLGQERPRAVAQDFGQRIDKTVWLGRLENVSLAHGVSLLRWRSGGLEHPHDTPPHPLMPSPTFGHSSRSVRGGTIPKKQQSRAMSL